jgi:hypothetical protein
MSTEYLAESLEHEVTCRVEGSRLSSIIGESSLELACCRGTRELLMLLECECESIHIDCEIMFLRELESHLDRESIGIKKGKRSFS